MRVIHSKSGVTLGKNVLEANTFWPRLVGFMFKNSPAPHDVIYFPKCNWVHNCFVRFSIDVVFTKKDGSIVAIVRNFKPWRFSRIYFKAADTLEFARGALPESVVVGDFLLIES